MGARVAKVLLSAAAAFGLTWAAPVDIQEVISALRSQDFQRALQIAKELQSQSAADPRVLTLEGMANEGLHNRAEALRDYRSAVQLKPDYVPALKAEAQLEYLNGDREAGKTLDRIVKLEPADQVSHAMLAGLAYKQGSCDGALNHYRRSAGAIAEKPDALTQFGECLLKEQQPAEAVSALRQVVSLQPDQWWPRYNLALAEMARKQPAAAIEVLLPVLQKQAAPPNVLDLAAEAYEENGDTPRAVDLLRKAILGDSKNESFYLHFADLSFDHQSFQVGVDVINAGLKQLPASAKLYLARGILLGQLGDFTKAEADFARADRLDSSRSISGAAASLAELQNSNLSKALELARVKLKGNGNDPMLYYVKAETLRQMGVEPQTSESNEAIVSAAAAVRLKPDFIAARNLLGSLYLQGGKIAAATEQFEAVLKIDGSNQTALYHLIQAARKDGRADEIPRLTKRLIEARQEERQKNEATLRYRLVEPIGPRGATR